MADQLELPIPLRLTNPRPVDFYYGPWSSVAAARVGVPRAVRYDGQTVMVAGVGEYCWLAADLSDAGLVVKGGSAAAATPPAADWTAGPYPAGTQVYNPADGFTYRSKGILNSTAAPGNYTSWSQSWTRLGYDDTALVARVAAVESRPTAVPFTPISQNQVGTHPAFTNQHSLNLWLLGRAGSTTPTPSTSGTYAHPSYGTY